MAKENIPEKIQDYERFIEEKLKIDLKEIEVILNEKVSKYKEWEEVKNVVETVKDFKKQDSDMLVRVDIGSGIMVTGEVTDYERTYICIGLDYMLEMDPEEAEKYSDIRLRLLKKEIDHFRKLAVNIKVHIKLVLLAINELQTSLGMSK